jgi:cyanoexosortase B
MMQWVKKLPFRSDRHLFYLSLALLLAILYAPILLKWYDGWLNKNISTDHEYFSHGMIGFPYAAYVVWQHRQQWEALTNKPHLLGAIFLGLGAACYLAGSPEVVYLSLPLVLVGICLWLKGIPGFKLQAFPLLLVFLATPNPIPYLLTPHTLWLQKFIAAVAGLILNILGIQVRVEGIHLALNDRLVEVAPYCAGLKMLFTSLYVALILLHWTGNLGNRRIVALLLPGAAAISVVANIIRNTLLTWFHGVGQEKSFEWLHAGWGGDLYSALMLLAIVWLLKGIEKWDFASESGDLESARSEREQSES